jgi:gamma-glutamylcyclotransferase (GGCT)/AIG2-like uncharacterized protein YtfP
MDDSLSPHLFVYGTLMTTATGSLGRDMRLRLRREARLIGAACLRGRLYDLGSYPGLVRSDNALELVHGEVLELMRPADSLPWLDAYEGVQRGPQAVGEYDRAIVEANLGAGGLVNAWVYLFNRPVVGLPWVRSGRWKSRN